LVVSGPLGLVLRRRYAIYILHYSKGDEEYIVLDEEDDVEGHRVTGWTHEGSYDTATTTDYTSLPLLRQLRSD
jgi:hypothetical protein